MGKGKHGIGKILFTVGGFFLGGGFWTGLSAGSWLGGAVLGASLGSSIWSATHKPKMRDFNAPEIQRFDKVQETMSSSANIPVVYGYRKIAGNQTYHQTNADQNTLHKHVVLCEGGIEGIESVSANDLLIPTGSQNSNTVFTIQNTIYEDATVRKDGKHLYLHWNGKDKDLYLANKDDAQNADTLWSWQTSVPELVTYLNKFGDGWQAFPTATTSKYPGDLWITYLGDFIGKATISFPYRTKNEEYFSYPPNSFVRKDVHYQLIEGSIHRLYNSAPFTWEADYNKYQQKHEHNCYKSPANVQADTITGGTNYTFYDSEAPSNYEEVGGYPKMAWLDMHFMVSSELNGNPSVSCFIKGRKVLDTRTNEVKYSTNPAMCLRDFILSKTFGLGKWISRENIDEDSFKEVADYCDEIIHYKGTSGEQIDCKRYELNIVIDQKQSALDWISDILGNFCGYIVCSQDKIFLKIEKPESTSYRFNDSNCSDLTVAPLTLDDTPNCYKVSFVDPLNNWNSVQAIVEDYADQKNRGKIITQEVTLEGTTSQNQALRLARFYRDYNAICFKTVSFKTGQQALHLEPGDVIELSFRNVFKDEPFRITEIKEDNDGTYEISARSYNKNIYNDYLGATLQVYSYATKPSSLYGAVPEIRDLKLSQEYYINNDGTVVSNIMGKIMLPVYDYFHRVLIFYMREQDADWIYYGSTTGDNFIINNAKTDEIYIFKIIVENTSGRRSQGYISPPYYVTGKDEPPSDVTEGHVWYNPNSTEIKLIWTGIEDKDLNHYEIQDENLEVIGETNFTSFSYEIKDDMAHKFYIYAIDNGGNKSVNPLVLTAQRDIIVDEVTGLSVIQDKNNLSKIHVSWNEIQDTRLVSYAIYINDKKIANTTETSYLITLEKSGEYTIGVKTYSMFNTESKGVFSTQAFKLEPEDVTEFSMTRLDTDRSVLQFTWNLVEHGVSYEIRLGDSWDTGKIITKTNSNNFTYQLRTEDVFKFFVKAIGINNFYSINAKELQADIVLSPNAPTNLKITQNQKDRSQIIVTWTPPEGHDIAGYKVFIDNQYEDSVLTNLFTKNLSASKDITVSVLAYTVANFESTKVNASKRIEIEPMDVTGFNITQNVSKKSEIHLYWDAPKQLDISHYELRMGESWDNATLVSSYITNNYYDMVINVEKTFHFWIKAVSNAGFKSLNPTHQECTFDLNPSAPTGLTVEQDKDDKSIVNVSWNPVNEFDISYYEVRSGYTWEDGEVLITTTNTRFSFKPKSDSGNINIMLKAVNTSGFYSDEVRGNLYAIYEPSDVTSFLAYQNGDYVDFAWLKIQDTDVVGYEIREGYSWDTGTVICSMIPTLSYEIKVSFEGTFKYMIKAINRAGKYSVHENSQIVKIENLSSKNIVLQIDELAENTGTHNQTEIAESLINWQTMGGKFSDYNNLMFSEIGGKKVLRLKQQPDGTFASNGVYTCGIIDVHQVIIANISCNFRSTSKYLSDISAYLEIRTSKDNVTWTDWTRFMDAQYNFRYIEIRCILKSNDPHKTVEVNSLQVVIDVPDREVTGNLDVPVGGTTVNYDKEFYIIPIVTPYALGYGIRCEITDKTKSSFKVRVLNENNQDVGGNVNWRARGY